MAEVHVTMEKGEGSGGEKVEGDGKVERDGKEGEGDGKEREEVVAQSKKRRRNEVSCGFMHTCTCTYI